MTRLEAFLRIGLAVTLILILAGGLGYVGITLHWPGLAAQGIMLSPSAAAGQGRHQYWQAGVSAGGDGQGAVAMRTTIRTVAAGHLADQTTDYYWIGSYLATGEFIQVGYAIPWYDRTAHWFYCAYDAGRHQLACPMGPVGSAGQAGAWHQYALWVTGGQTGRWTWTATMDGTPLGTLVTSANSTGLMAPSIYVEQSAFAPVAATNDLGQAEFKPAIEFEQRGDGAYHAALSAQAAYSQDDVCPPFGMRLIRPDDVILGRGLSCPANFAGLW